jgi:hypothetical protein
MMLSEHFSLRELTASQTAARLGIDNTPGDAEIAALRQVCENILEPIREYFGIPFTPSSGYRSVRLCEAIGSKSTSQHALGQAVDFEVPHLDNLILAHWIKANLRFDQLILEFYEEGEPNSGWVHASYADGMRGQCLTYNKQRGYSIGLPKVP